MEQKNCAFQYAKIENGYFQNTKIVCDKTSLTLNEAKGFWNDYYSDAASWIKDGNSVEMVIWINMDSPSSYGETLQFISFDAESDGERIWETRKNYFTKEFKTEE